VDHAGSQHQPVEATEHPERLRDDRGHCAGLRDVTRYERRTRAAGQLRTPAQVPPAERHLGAVGSEPLDDGSPEGEEFQCAQARDSLPAVRYWVRNVANHAESFWLPTAAGRFYPDFVARLKDDRLLVVEYKGAHLAEGADTAEKRTIGNLWEQRSNGRCLVVEKVINGEDMRSQLLEKVGQ